MNRLTILALLLLPALASADQYDAERAAIKQQIAVLQARLDYLNNLPTVAPTSQQWNADGSVTINGVRYVPMGQATSAACAPSPAGFQSVTVQAVDASGVRFEPVRRFLRRAPRGGASGGSS